MALASFLDRDDYTHEIKGIRYPPIVNKDNLEAMANFDLRDDDIAIVTFPKAGADTLLAVSESYVYEDVDSPLKSPKPRGTGVWPSAKNEALEKANKTKPTKEEPPPLPPPRRVDDALFAVSQPHLYEDVDAPPKSPIPTGAGPRNFAKNKTIVTGNKNKTVKDEPPPLPPPRKGDLTMPSVSQPHLYEDEDAPPKSPKPTGTGLRQIAKNKTIVTENKNISVKDEPPPLPPPRKGDLTMSSVSQPHLYEDVDAPPKSPKPTGTCRRQFTKNEAHGTGIKSNPTKEEPPPLPPPRKGTDVLPAVSQPHAHVDTPQKRPKQKGAALKQFAMSLGTVIKNKPPKDKLPPVPPQGKCTEARFEKSAGANANLHVYENNEFE
ncbi:formin-like protein 14 [Branchiostoma floridae]|uniref:Formin-like protein 14 n=1 Tax=Branchiostoma floridae TaxID=7739 RepID=A0A9J7L934_BRAFL|nr:formin-like protein 14 [Branchiostoma floridae]